MNPSPTWNTLRGGPDMEYAVGAGMNLSLSRNTP